MRRVITLTAFMVLVVMALIVAFRSIPPGSASSSPQSPERAASSLQTKIDTIKKADADKNRRVQQKMEIYEAELESYILIDLRKNIPVHMESIHVQLTPGTIAANTRLTFPSGSTGNFFVDTLVSGTHNFYIKGKLTGARGEGKFDLQEVTVDGIPFPSILIDTLVKRYVDPKYPDTDLKKPFDLPWGIDAVDIGQGKATVTY